MQYTNDLFQVLLKFQNDRKNINDDYDNQQKNLEPMRGSRYYDEKSREIKNSYVSAISGLQERCRIQVGKLFMAMNAAIEKKPMSAPTTEMINILSLLKLKENPSSTDFETAANACCECGLALSIIQQEAMKQGYMKNLMGRCLEASPVAASNILKNLDAWTADFLDSDETKASRIARQHDININGTSSLPPQKRKLFDSKEMCYAELGLSPSDLRILSSVVDD